MLDWLSERVERIAALGEQVLPAIRERLSGGTLTIPDDLEIHDNGLLYYPGEDRLRALWFHVTEREGGREYTAYRAVRLRMLYQIPVDARGDIGLLAKMRDVLKGLYGAGVDVAYLVAGVYNPRPLGIVQMYGVIGQADTLEEAVEKAEQGVGVMEATLAAAYPQIRFRDLDSYLGNWISDALTEKMPYGLVAVGHPDPRENSRGGDPALSPGGTLAREGRQQFTLQQNELVMRGMAQLREDFLIQVLLSPVDRRAATQMLTGLAEYTSTWASWQTGVRSFNVGTSVPMLLSGALTHGAGTGYTASKAHSTTDGQTHTTSESDTVGHSQSHTEGQTVTDGVSTSVGRSHTEGHMVSDGHATSHTVSDTTSSSQTNTQGQTSFRSIATQGGFSVSAGLGGNLSRTVTDGGGSSQSQSQTAGHSHTEIFGETTTHQETLMTSDTTSVSVTRSHSVAKTTSDTTTESQSRTTGTSEGTTHTEGDTRGEASARGLSRGFSSGMAIGLSPSVSIGESNQWQFDPAIIITNVLRQQQEILNRVTLEGGFYADVYALARTERGHQALMALIPEAFQGREDVVTGVQTRAMTTPEEHRYIRTHAKVMVPSTREVRIPELVTAYADSTLLTLEQAAAYMAPGMFEEGAALTVQEKIPDFAFRPNMKGDVILGLQYSTERGELTDVPLMLTPERHFHTAFVGDTGFGKSVAAERLAYESTLQWHYRTIILDFGQGWRKALNWPGLEFRADIYQLYAGAVRPIRWNPLQVPKRIHPSRYRTLVAELYANAGRMGPRQLGFMRETLSKVYHNAGVLVDDKSNGHWQIVDSEAEEEAINAARRERGLAERRTKGYSVLDLEPFERQALAVYRSRRADLAEWIGLLREEMQAREKARDYASVSSLQGALLRLEQLVDYEMRRMYGPGDDTVAIEDLGLNGPVDDPWGVTVIEGGAELDEFTKAALLAQLASILYLDAVVRRRESLSGRRFPPMQIFFEEANKVLTGVDVGGATSDNAGQGNQTTQIFLDMWRDGRKYRVFLHLIAQTVSELPAGILSSCNNGFFGQTKNDRDRSALLAHLARNTKGFVNTQYDRFLARMPVAMAVAKLGYSMDIGDIEPFLIRPLMLSVEEPSDEEIAHRRRVRLLGQTAGGL